jgi:outer membrane protein OmpA-like peptidoglycan-associated protein
MWIFGPLWGALFLLIVVSLVVYNGLFLAPKWGPGQLEVAARALQPVASGAKLRVEDLTTVVVGKDTEVLDRPVFSIIGKALSQAVAAGQLLTSANFAEPIAGRGQEALEERRCLLLGRGSDNESICFDDGVTGKTKVAESLMRYLDRRQRDQTDGTFSALITERFLNKFMETYALKLADRVFGTTPVQSVSVTPAKLYFGYGSSTPNPSGIEDLSKITKAVDANCITLVAGYADGTGRPGLNMALAWRRSQAVVNLLFRQGIDRRRILIAPPGQEVLAADERLGVPENRRVDVHLVCGELSSMVDRAMP